MSRGHETSAAKLETCQRRLEQKLLDIHSIEAQFYQAGGPAARMRIQEELQVAHVALRKAQNRLRACRPCQCHNASAQS